MAVLWRALAESPFDLTPKLQKLISRAGGIRSLARASGLSKDTVRSLAQGGGTLKSYLLLTQALGVPPKIIKKPRCAPCLSSGKDDWTTPSHLLNLILNVLGRKGFDLDPCSPSLKGPVPASRYYTRREDGLKQAWEGLVFVNPPYSQMRHWSSKLVDAAACGVQIIALVPSRTGTQWWHQVLDGGARPIYLRGRLRFGEGIGQAPFDSTILLFNFSDFLAEQMARKVGGRLM
ncbi:phage N-6-adenine-methyltransferase [Acidithiobacillus sp. GGI-221]|nr:phage N-6-adenine-methyltransferase [Acidithiobacillus sp. GGI-221]